MYMTLENSVDGILRYSVFTDILARRLGVLSVREDTAAWGANSAAQALSVPSHSPLQTQQARWMLGRVVYNIALDAA